MVSLQQYNSFKLKHNVRNSYILFLNLTLALQDSEQKVSFKRLHLQVSNLALYYSRAKLVAEDAEWLASFC